MKISEIQKMADKDLNIDKDNLDITALESPYKTGKYLQIRSNERLLIVKYKNDKKQIWKDLWLYYMGKAPDEVYKENPQPLKIIKSDVAMHIESDPKYVAVCTRLEYQQEKVNYLDGVITAINNLRWDIKNAIDWQKHITGK